MPAARTPSRKPAPSARARAKKTTPPSSSAELERARARERDAIFDGLERVEGGSAAHRKLLERLGAWQRGAPPAATSSRRSTARSSSPATSTKRSSSPASRDVVRMNPSRRVVESRSCKLAGVGDVTFELRYVQQAARKSAAPIYSGSTSSSATAWFGPYWYAERRDGERVVWVYVGKRFDKDKARRRLLAKGVRS